MCSDGGNGLRVLKDLRQSKKITQDKLSAALGVSRSTISMWEIDASEPDKDMLSRIADYFNVTIDFLLGRSDDPNPTASPDDEFWEMRRVMAERPEMKVLFSTAKTADKNTLLFADEMIRRMRKESGYDNDED
jgi:transcriptional regulator with XRE-family HTH domain